MARIQADRVAELSTTTGTGAFTLAGALTGFRAFSAVCTTSDTVSYTIEAIDGSGAPLGDWETGIGTYSGANTLTRTAVSASSNAGAAVNFAAGVKRVFLNATKGLQYTQPPFANVSSLLHFNGSDGSTTITDATGLQTWTCAGTSALDTAESVFGGSSLHVPSGSLGIAADTNSGFDVGTGDWTIEFRWKRNGAPGTSARIFCTRDGDVFSGISLLITSGGNLELYMSSAGVSSDIINAYVVASLSTTAWNRVLVQRRGGGRVETYLDGGLSSAVSIGTTASVYYNSGHKIIIGSNFTGTARSMNGWMDEFRFTKGLALISPAEYLNDTAFADS